MLQILFTKYYPASTLANAFDASYEVTSKDFIETKFVSLEQIKNQLPKESHQFIVTSLRAAKHIDALDLQGQFYGVGDKSGNFLKAKGKEVVLIAEDASHFLVELENRYQTAQNYVYFCSDIRKDKLPEGVRHLGHQCTEIVTYKITSKKVELKETYQAYVFFSPSGVKSFAEQYGIPKKAVIFAIGETTAKEVYASLNVKPMIADRPNLESLIKTIKAYFNAKK